MRIPEPPDEFLLGRTVDYGLAVLLGLVEGYEDTTFGIFRPVPTMKENILESLDVEYHGEDAAELRGIAQDYAVVRRPLLPEDGLYLRACSRI